MGLRPLLIGGLVLAVRLLTFPRTPWDADELRFPFALMVAIAIAASVVTAIAFTIAFRDDVAAVLFSLSAAVLVHAPMARLDAVAWMFVALALVTVARRDEVSVAPLPLATLFGGVAGAVVACKPAFIVSALTLLIAGLFLVFKDKRERMLAGLAFAVVAVPFLVVPEDISGVAGWNVVRFTLHPWGSKFVALPLLIAVAAGIRPLVRAWSPKLEVLMWFSLVHVATGIAAVKPADGVRWAVPSLMFTALVAAMGLRALRVQWIGAAVLGALSLWYAWPILRDRVTRPSPLIEAKRAVPKDVVVLLDAELDREMPRYLDRTDVQLLHFADGKSDVPGARVFSRGEHDAYGKLTRNAYGHVSLIPIAVPHAPAFGVYGMQRDARGESWRWLRDAAEIRVRKGAGPARVTLRLPADAPIPFNDVTVNDRPIRLNRGESASVDVGAARAIVIRASRTFVQEERVVSVQLLGVSR